MTIIVFCLINCSIFFNVLNLLKVQDVWMWLTRDLELCLDGGRNSRTVVGVSFSMECLLWGVWRLSGCGVEEMGRNIGGAGGHSHRKRECRRKQMSQFHKERVAFDRKTEHGLVHTEFVPGTRQVRGMYPVSTRYQISDLHCTHQVCT